METLSSITDPEKERFDCNICSASEPSQPVVTLCGHLYCWPCIYSQLQGDCRRCPVCEATISDASLVPLYGLGSGVACGPHALLPGRPLPPKLNLGSVAACDTLASDSGFSWERGTPGSFEAESDGGDWGSHSCFWAAIGVYRNPCDSHRTVGDFNPRARRRELRIEQSLQRVSFFIFCCLIMCLLFF